MKKAIFVLIFLLLFTITDNARADKITDALNKLIFQNNISKKPLKIGVLVNNRNNPSREYNVFIDEVQKRLIESYNNEALIVVERSFLEHIIEEQKLIASGLTENESLNIGKLAGLDLLLLYIIYSDCITIKLLNIFNGQILAIQTQREEVLLKRQVTVPAGKILDFKFYVETGTTLSISVESSSDVNVWFVDSFNRSRFLAGQRFSYYTDGVSFPIRLTVVK
jgi:hypothetical protein